MVPQTMTQSQKLSLERKLTSASQTVDYFQKIVMALARDDVPCLRALLQAALNHHASPEQILCRLGEAIDRVYRSCKYSVSIIHIS